MLLGMARRHEELHPAQRGFLDPPRDGEVEDGPVTVLDLATPATGLECSKCGYGIVRAEPPERCPMCHSVDAWDLSPWRPFRRRSFR